MVLNRFRKLQMSQLWGDAELCRHAGNLCTIRIVKQPFWYNDTDQGNLTNGDFKVLNKPCLLHTNYTTKSSL